jgi:hypothetical protein
MILEKTHAVFSDHLLAIASELDGVYAIAAIIDEEGQTHIMQVARSESKDTSLDDDVMQDLADTVRAVLESKLGDLVVN